MNKIKEITIKDLNLLKELSDSALGKDYLSLDYFNKVIDSPLYHGWTLCSDNQVLIAFLVVYKTTSLEIQNRLNDFSIEKKLKDDTMCFDTMVVHSDYRNKGIGKLLIGNALLMFSKSNVIMYAWKNKGRINMKKIADYYKFKKLKEYSELWKTDCLNNKFYCPEKKDNRCTCSTVVYHLSRL